ncbi:MAG: F0F1 ATP synthase subunit delta [Candidatus Planktophila sp.]
MRIHLGGSSRQSLVIARGKLDAAVKGASAATASEISSHLFFAAEVFAGNTSLRRAITDPSRDIAAKSALIADLFSSKIGKEASTLISDVAALRWSASKDVIYILEQLAIEAEASAANINNELDRVEDELFSASRSLLDSSELRSALVGGAGADLKAQLVTEILSKSASASTVKLVRALVTQRRGRSLEAAFADYLFGLANRRNRLIAVVRTAAPISDAQKVRLSGAIEKQVGQPIRVNIQVDPTILGGVSIKFADELIDASISNRLAHAGRALAGKN